MATINNNPANPPQTSTLNPTLSERREELYYLWRPVIRELVDEFDLVMPAIEWMKDLIWAGYDSMALLNAAALQPPTPEVRHRHIEHFLRDAIHASSPALQPSRRPFCYPKKKAKKQTAKGGNRKR